MGPKPNPDKSKTGGGAGNRTGNGSGTGSAAGPSGTPQSVPPLHEMSQEQRRQALANQIAELEKQVDDSSAPYQQIAQATRSSSLERTRERNRVSAVII